MLVIRPSSLTKSLSIIDIDAPSSNNAYTLTVPLGALRLTFLTLSITSLAAEGDGDTASAMLRLQGMRARADRTQRRRRLRLGPRSRRVILMNTDLLNVHSLPYKRCLFVSVADPVFYNATIGDVPVQDYVYRIRVRT